MIEAKAARRSGDEREPLTSPDLTLPRVVAALHTTARAASLLPVLVGVLVLIGWSADIETLKRVMPGLTAMNPMTAVGFIALGCALAVESRAAGRPKPMVTAALAAVAVILGVSRILALVGVWDAELDRLMFRDKLELADFGRPNRIAPNTAINFLLVGTALLLMDRAGGRMRSLAQLLALVAGITSLLALMGYAYGLRPFYGIGSQIAMALPTAATFFVVSVGILCIRPAHGMMTVVSSDSSGGTMVRRLLPAVLFVPAVLGALRLGGQRVMVFDTAFGFWLLVVSIMTVLAVLVAWNAQLLLRSDIDRAHAERTLAHQAMHDALTQLPNRRLLIQRLSDALDTGAREKTLTAVVLVDLDLFKVINDSLGHVVGDELLIAAGQRIRECVTDSDVVGRLSGDEFTVLLAGLASHDRAIEAADRIRNAFDMPFKIGLHEVFTSVSIGIAFAEAGESQADLIRHADIAMYRAKARGRARWEIFDPAMDVAARERQRLETDLRRALERGELRVYYQPEVEIETGHLVGMEALVRWHHPERGLVPPAEFIAVAEETGLIVPIGR